MAEQVNFWKSEDGSLHKTEAEAVEADIAHLGGDGEFYNLIVEKLEKCNESISFRHDAIPPRIAYRLMYSGYIGQLYTWHSNADSADQYQIIFYKKGVKPTTQLNMVIQHEKTEKYKHFKELYANSQ